MNDKTTAAISRMEAWLWDNGGRCTRQFVDDMKTLIQAVKDEQRQELVRRFAVAIASNSDYHVTDAWTLAAKLANAEPPANP